MNILSKMIFNELNCFLLPNPERNQHLISPYSNMAESFINFMRIK